MARGAGATYKMRPEVSRYLAPGVTYDPLRQPLYDRAIFAAGAQAAGTTAFFQTPVGGAKTELDTNLRLAAQIPANHVFECWSPRVVIRPVQPSHIGALAATDVITDVELFMFGTFVRFKIVSQEKLLVPSYFLPAAAGVFGFAAVTAAAVNAEIANNGEPTQFSATRLDPFPIIIPPLQQFTVELTIPVTFTTQNIVHVWLVLDGILHRPALP
jgi:hypothetical protein